MSSFQLTSSQGGWQELQNELAEQIHFNSHPHKEDDAAISASEVTSWSYFNSHPHEEDDRIIYCVYKNSRNFNSHPHEEDDLVKRCENEQENISTHILTRRMTSNIFRYSWLHFHFNSHPHEEDDDNILFLPILFETFQLTSSRGGWQSVLKHTSVSKTISTHILTRRMTLVVGFRLLLTTFQLTSSRGGWQQEYILSCVLDISTHILTRRMTFPYRLTILQYKNFNSHPHEEDDFHMSKHHIGMTYISTHILTRRMTLKMEYQYHRLQISTHILTRRMTPNDYWQYNLYSFQLTSSRGGWRSSTCRRFFCK